MTLQLRAINKRFGERQVLHQLDLDVANGECVALLGASGCGKSTALRLIAGLDHPDKGSILINGAEMVDVPSERRRVGMVFQSYALFPHLNVWDNLELGLRMRCGSAAARDERIRGVLEVLQLSGQARQRPSQLSGGQRQRVALARALLRDPLVYLLDEPMSNLDAQLREDLRPQLRRLMIGGEQPVVYVTHDQQEAMALADRIAVMREGRIEQIGTPRELYLQPASTYVAQFIGRPQMNLLPAKDGVITGIRPDDLRLDPAGSPCTILSREWFGANQMLLVRCDRSDLRLVCPGEAAIEAEPRISWPSACEHRFDAVSGRRLPSD
ncbi:ATPase [Synechococcus sp. WH 8109]|uniref:ABC transporter ATP-binding protein n=1 Tax=Synechococcus sp. WH 8109 TaxID=166314 RepID=UPI0001B8D295|nr:ABC transporter ATP-binding protein [Synechococcus sp. WH 8109]AHF63620.1 ATPase [Synechococcus sp. WH 8109]